MKHLPLIAAAAAAFTLTLGAAAVGMPAYNVADEPFEVAPSPEPPDPHAAHRAAAAEKPVSAPKTARTDVKLTDVKLTDQTGRSARLSSDFLKNRVVVFDFIFTTCTTICPVSTSLLATTKAKLKDLDPNAYAFVSISIDPNTDTPERMAAFAQKRGADWTFLTGERHVVEKVLKDLGSYSTNPADHSAMLVIGDASNGEFVRAFGLPNPDFVAAEVRRLVAARQHHHHH